eukprot:scaffold178_cov163-Amphora_coffeaeformis.AAC.6
MKMQPFKIFVCTVDFEIYSGMKDGLRDLVRHQRYKQHHSSSNKGEMRDTTRLLFASSRTKSNYDQRNATYV